MTTEAATDLIKWPELPEDEDTATMDTLARYYAQTYQINNGAVQVFSPDDPRWARCIERMVHAYTAAYLCRALLRTADCDDTFSISPDVDGVAREIVKDLNAGDSPGEWVWEWLTGWGMDPDALADVGKRHAESVIAKRGESA